MFGFFLFTPSGDRLNLALVPGTGDRVSVNTVNPTANSQYFVNNDYDPLGSPYNLEYDGFTTVFTAQALGLTPGTYRMKLAIADTADHLVDSAVFIQAGSFRIVPDAGGTLALMSLALGSLSWVAWRRRSDGLA